MATTTIYPISYSNGYTPPNGRGISITMPSTYQEGDPIKWIVYLHCLDPGPDGISLTDTAHIRSLVDAYNIAVVTINSYIDSAYLDTDLRPAAHIAEGIALAKTIHNFTHYLPGLYGYSAGSASVLKEWRYNGALYSCFGGSSIVTDIFAAGLDTHEFDINAMWASTIFGGPTTSVDPTIHARWLRTPH
jgi:hypothetical protein